MKRSSLWPKRRDQDTTQKIELALDELAEARKLNTRAVRELCESERPEACSEPEEEGAEPAR